MSSDPVLFGLTQAQATALSLLRDDYSSRLSGDPLDPTAWFGQQLADYLSALSIDAIIETYEVQSRRSASLRPSLLRNLVRHLGRPVNGDDLVQELARLVSVPEAIAEAIRRDVERLQK
jgi:hypothetical protein